METRNDNSGMSHFPLKVNFILTKKNNASNKAVANTAKT
jgi:hypothetical protein